jgi:hypothetical protein
MKGPRRFETIINLHALSVRAQKLEDALRNLSVSAHALVQLYGKNNPKLRHPVIRDINAANKLLNK